MVSECSPDAPAGVGQLVVVARWGFDEARMTRGVWHLASRLGGELRLEFLDRHLRDRFDLVVLW